MADDLDKIICVHYMASRRVKESERKDSEYYQWGCYECTGNKEGCDKNIPLSDVMYEVEEE